MQSTDYDIETARLIRDNELESAKLTARHWRYGFWAVVGIAAIAVAGNTWQGTQHRWILRYVEVDKASEQSRIIQPAAERYEPAQAIVKGTLEGYLKTLRSVGKDKQLMDDNWESLKVCLTPGGRQRLREYAIKDDPRKQLYPRAVQMTSRLPKTARTYDFRWQEWQYGANDGVEGTAMWSASLTFERRDPRTEHELAHCPTGIFLESWVLGKDL